MRPGHILHILLSSYQVTFLKFLLGSALKRRQEVTINLSTFVKASSLNKTSKEMNNVELEIEHNKALRLSNFLLFHVTLHRGAPH